MENYKFQGLSQLASGVQSTMDLINEEGGGRIVGQLNDGHHSFDELYEFRKLYNAAFFQELHEEVGTQIYKSKRHNDGELCFGGGWFIVVAELPTGQISNHYRLEDWDLFNVPEEEIPPTEYDGHTPQDVVDRLTRYINGDY